MLNEFTNKTKFKNPYTVDLREEKNKTLRSTFVEYIP